MAPNSVKETPSRSVWNNPVQVYDLDFKSDNNDGSQQKMGEELLALCTEFIKDNPVISIEDPFDQDDFIRNDDREAQVVRCKLFAMTSW